MFMSSYQAAVSLRGVVFSTLEDLGMALHPSKGFHDPVQSGEHLDLVIDLHKGKFRAPVAKLLSIARLAKSLLYKATTANKRWFPAKTLARLEGMAQFLYLAIIPAARFYLRELHDVVSTRTTWSASMKMFN